MTTLRSADPRRIYSVGPRSLPTARVVTAVVQQPVHLSPSGNTVAMTVGAEMPFASGRRIVISTQESGGVSQAPNYMRSRGGMFAGLGADLPRSGLTREEANNIAYGDQTGLDPATVTEADAVIGGTMLAADDAAPAAPAAPAAATATTPATSSWDWSKIGQTTAALATTGATVYNQTRKPTTPGAPAPAPVYRAAAPAASNTKMYLIIGGVAAVGLLALIMLRKRGAAAPATNPRRRR